MPVKFPKKRKKKYEQKKYPERGSNPHDVAIGGF